MWFVIETVYYVSMDDTVVEGVFGAYSSEEEAFIIAAKMVDLDDENERNGVTYAVMQAEMF